ncbi:MAG: ferritin [Cytophagales bacterium]|nr:ferritin [Cytophagales bacterium]
MKDLLTQERSITLEVEAALNKQIMLENQSCHNYMAMASWCRQNGFDHAYEFFMNQSDEEREHMKKFYRYIDNVGGKASPGKVNPAKEDFDSFRQVFEYMLEQEIAISKSINGLAGLAEKFQDYSTAEFMDWFLAEQREEVYTARRILKLFDIMGHDGIGLYHIEKELANIEYKE